VSNFDVFVGLGLLIIVKDEKRRPGVFVGLLALQLVINGLAHWFPWLN
jgi:hypothetical protein